MHPSLDKLLDVILFALASVSSNPAFTSSISNGRTGVTSAISNGCSGATSTISNCCSALSAFSAAVVLQPPQPSAMFQLQLPTVITFTVVTATVITAVIVTATVVTVTFVTYTVVTITDEQMHKHVANPSYIPASN